MATPILSFTLPAGLYASSLPISSAPQSGATRVKRTSGVPPTRSARLAGMALASGLGTYPRLSPGGRLKLEPHGPGLGLGAPARSDLAHEEQPPAGALQRVRVGLRRIEAGAAVGHLGAQAIALEPHGHVYGRPARVAH